MQSSRHKLFAVVSVAMLSLVFPSSSFAGSHHPKGEYARFAECPLSIKTVTDCVFLRTSGGGFRIGARRLSLANSLTLQGGFEGGGNEIKFHGAENGETIPPQVQPLPGFLEVSAPTSWPDFLQEWFDEAVKKEGYTGVVGTVELAAPASSIKLSTENLILEEGKALELPVKIGLTNEVLGEGCQVGSNAKPLLLNFTTARSGSLQGSAGNLSFNNSSRMSTVTDGKLVDGTYAAPTANGCGGMLSPFIDPLINSILGLPSPSGKNTAILEGKLQDANAEAVKASE